VAVERPAGDELVRVLLRETGDRLSFADIMAGHLLYRYFTLDFERADAPNLAAYYQRLGERPAYREHVMVSYESLRAE
jgi:glutathione S-transferase